MIRTVFVITILVTISASLQSCGGGGGSGIPLVAGARFVPLYAFDAATGNLMDLNGNDGTTLVADSTSPMVMDGMAYDPATRLIYASEALSGTLFEWNDALGVYTTLGQTGYTDLYCLTMDPSSGILYGVGLDGTTNEYHLLNIDKSTGMAMSIMPVGIIPMQGLAFDTSRSILYYVRDTEFGSLDTITMNVNTIGTTESFRPFGIHTMTGLAYDAVSNTLYALSDWGSLTYINRDTAEVYIAPNPLGMGQPVGLAPAR